MESKADAEHPPQATPVREQRTIGPGGSEEVRQTVYCSVKEGSIPVSTCAPCPHLERVVVDPTGRRSEVVCGMPPPPAPGEGVDPLRMQWRVAELMTRRVICVRTNLPVRAVLMVLVEHGISGTPVVDAAGRPVGMVTFTDLLREQYDQIEDEEDELLPHWVRGAVERHRVGARPGAHAALVAEDIMTPSVFSIREDSRVSEAAAEMARRGVHRVPVVGRDGSLVGIVSALDLVRWVSASVGSPAGPAVRAAEVDQPGEEDP